MTKGIHIKPNKSKERGQISIFFASSLIVLVTVIAFIVNIGLFVKAKINLQNATDAAAYAGASVQSQHLTRIAYLNWEMRNIYKEWMFKYYVLGNLNIKDVENAQSAGAPIKFTMEADTDIDNAVKIEDQFNFPSVCLHFSTTASNVCKKYAVPGIPRFDATNSPGIDEATSAMVDSIVKTKAEDCSKRTQLNMAVTTTWAYGIPNDSVNNFASKVPQVAADRAGAWPKAVELAMRIRNLEYAMNRKPYTGGVCFRQSDAASNCETQIDSITTEYGNERVSKAFYSALRNLGNDEDNEMKGTFKLTELSPKEYAESSPYSLSYLFIPPGKRTKYYVDLKLMTVNYATFFTSLIARDDQVTGVATQGACDVSKTAIPVPGYPLGFYKNPALMTYYAVKGEAKFEGLFNPFRKSPLKLTAYAAAKPFGGRIGPMLFAETENTGELRSRVGGNVKLRSIPYIAGLDIKGTMVKKISGGGQEPFTDKYAPGIPIPYQAGFWVGNPEDIIGGVPQGDSDRILYSIPNMIYDVAQAGNFDTTDYAKQSGSKLFVIKSSGTDQPKIGLFHHTQMKIFRSLLTNLTPEGIKEGIIKAREPTQYEAGNYLIPTSSEFMTQEYDTWGYVTETVGADKTRDFFFFAPLYSDREEVLYKSSSQVIDEVKKYLNDLAPSIEKFRDALNEVAISIRNAGSVTQDQLLYQKAAESISDIPDLDENADLKQTPGSCVSVNGKFLHFLLGGLGIAQLTPTNAASCANINSLVKEMGDYYSNASISAQNFFDQEFYHFRYSEPRLAPSILLSAYRPGLFTGADSQGIFQSPFGGQSDMNNMKRNSYSTKFVNLKALMGDSSNKESFFGNSLPLYLEGKFSDISDPEVKMELKNTLDATLEDVFY